MKVNEAHRAESHGAQEASEASSLEEFQELSRRYRDVQALRNATVVTMGVSAIAWALFADIYHFLWGAKEAYPTQALLVQRIGWCERTIRDHLRELEDASLLVVVRRKRPAPFGGFKLYYLPGPALIEALRVLVVRSLSRANRLKAFRPSDLPETPLAAFPSERRESNTSSASTQEKLACDLEASGMTCRVHPAPHADNLFPSEISSTLSLRTGLRKDASTPPDSAPPSAETKVEFLEGGEEREPEKRGLEEKEPEPSAPAEPVISLEDARIAAELLAHRLLLAHPHAPVGASARGQALALVTYRVAELGDLDPAEKLCRGKLAVESAHRRSMRKTGRSPTVGFIFGSEAFFRGHIERGLEEGHRQPSPPPNAEPPQSVQEASGRAEPAETGNPPPPRLKDHDEPASGQDSSEAARYAEEHEQRRLEATRELEKRRCVELARAAEVAALFDIAATPAPVVRRANDAEAHARARAELLAEMTPEQCVAFELAEARAKRRAEVKLNE